MDSSTLLYAQTLSEFETRKRQNVPPADLVADLADRYYEICRRHLEDMTDVTGDDYISPIERENIQLEKDTWALVKHLYSERIESELTAPPSASSLALLQKNPYTPPHSIASRLYDESPQLRELEVVGNWLRDIAPGPQQVDRRASNYRMHSKRALQHSARVGSAAGSNLVRTLDPDAPSREDGKRLDASDEAYERDLAYAIFSYIRSGRLPEGLKLAQECGMPMLAAVLQGAQPFRWDAIASRDPSGNPASMDEQFDAQAWSGNKRRKLWRETCTVAACTPAIPESTRALFASVCLSSRSMPSLVPLLRSWEDHLWARTSMLVDERISSSLEALGGFWENGMKVGKGGTGGTVVKGEDEWSNEVARTIDELAEVRVDDGPDASHPVHYAQLRVILNDTDSMLTNFANIISQGNAPADSRQWSLIVRFYTHLCLFLRIAGRTVPAHATDVILSAYTDILEAQGHGNLVAMYLGALSESAVDKYAAYLARLDPALPRSQREEALKQCEDHGLNVEEVAIMTTSKISNECFAILPKPRGPLPAPSVGPENLSVEEQRLVRSVEWLLYPQGTHDKALKFANDTIRYFLGIGRVTAARALYQFIPTTLVRARDMTEFHSPEAIEHYHYRLFFNFLDEVERVPDVGEYPVHESAMRRAEWKGGYLRQIDVATKAGVEVLEAAWLTGRPFQLFDSRRLNELDRVRKIHLPEVVMRLTLTLYVSRDHAPENLHKAIEIVTLVADDRHLIQHAFVTPEENKLVNYLSSIRLVELALLSRGQGSSELFEPIKRASRFA